MPRLTSRKRIQLSKQCEGNFERRSLEAGSEDRIRALIMVLATGDIDNIRRESSRLFKEIQQELNSLNKDMKLIRKLVARFTRNEDPQIPADNAEPPD